MPSLASSRSSMFVASVDIVVGVIVGIGNVVIDVVIVVLLI